MNFEHIVVFCTTPEDEKIAKKLADLIIKEKLAACVNTIKSVNSSFIWQNQIDNENENLLIIKTVSSKYKELEKSILQNHPYDCPEIIAIPIVNGSAEYLKWINDSCS